MIVFVEILRAMPKSNVDNPNRLKTHHRWTCREHSEKSSSRLGVPNDVNHNVRACVPPRLLRILKKKKKKKKKNAQGTD